MAQLFSADAKGVDPAANYEIWLGLEHTVNASGEDVFLTKEADGKINFFMICSKLVKRGSRLRLAIPLSLVVKNFFHSQIQS
jgi:hypothetical protein